MMGVTEIGIWSRVWFWWLVYVLRRPRSYVTSESVLDWNVAWGVLIFDVEWKKKVFQLRLWIILENKLSHDTNYIMYRVTYRREMLYFNIMNNPLQSTIGYMPHPRHTGTMYAVCCYLYAIAISPLTQFAAV